MPRCFIALPVPQKISKVLSDSVRASGPELKLVPDINYHITLAFLSEQSSEKIATIGKLLRDISFPVFEINLDRIAPFPHSSSSILATWVCNSESLAALHQTILAALERAQISIHDKGKFLPHITLARSKGGQQLPDVAIDLCLTVNCVNLYLSEPGSGTQKYSVIESVAAIVR